MNEPMFPGNHEVVYEHQESPRRYNEGMSIRDYFAAKAMEKYMNTLPSILQVAEASYMLADAMLKERAK